MLHWLNGTTVHYFAYIESFVISRREITFLVLVLDFFVHFSSIHKAKKLFNKLGKNRSDKTSGNTFQLCLMTLQSLCSIRKLYHFLSFILLPIFPFFNSISIDLQESFYWLIIFIFQWIFIRVKADWNCE